MKKKIKYLLLFVIIAGLSFMIYQSIHKLEDKKQKEAQRQQLPDFEFQTLDNTTFRKSDIPPGFSILIIYFNPECDQCEYEAKEIKANIHKFKKTRILMIAKGPADMVSNFATKYDLITEQGVKFLIDTKEIYYKIFDARNTPNLFIYNQEQKLLAHYEGQTKIDAILKHLAE